MPTDKYSDINSRLKAVMETANDGIITINDRGIIEFVNPAAARLFGYEPQEMLGNNIKMMMPEPDRSRHDGYLDNYHRTGVAKIIGIGRDVNGKKKDGTTFPFRLSISEVKLEGRRVYTGIVHDLSREKQMEKELLNANANLENKVKSRTTELAKTVSKLLEVNQKLNKEIAEHQATEQALRQSQSELKATLEKEKELGELKSRFVSMASHEFRTPLSSILSSAEIIEWYKTEAQHPKRLKHIQRIKSSVKNLTGILNDLLSLSKLEEGKVEVHAVEFDLNSFCKEILDEMMGLLKPNQQLIHRSKHEDIIVLLDKKIVKNILFNLLSNSIKYSKEGQSIYCYTSIENGYLTIEIKDQGIGIPMEDQKYLFSRFFRAHNVENIKGTGLGLNIVKRYVDLMEGQISFESELDKGSSFFVRIPYQSKEKITKKNH